MTVSKNFASVSGGRLNRGNPVSSEPTAATLLRFFEDLVVGDRRLFERKDLSVDLRWGVEPSMAENPLLTVISQPEDGQFSFQVLDGKRCGLFQVRTSSVGGFDPEEFVRLRLLGGLTVQLQFGSTNNMLFVAPILKDIRHSLALSQTLVADEMGIPRRSLSRLESGVQDAASDTLYSWCQALGLVCPPKTALVRVVDFSPELLRFLQEDPTRLRSLTPDEFERFVAGRLDCMGYNVTLTGASNRKDGGIDLIAVPKVGTLGSLVIAGQVKHHQGDQKTGRGAVDRLLAWKDSVFRAGLLVTNTTFTKDAIWTAQQERNSRFLRLRDFTDLKRWLQDQWGTEEDWREIPDRIELAPGVVIEIPRPRIISPFSDLEHGND
jgi:transcriptional regulator with XRE-family HTH domain